MRMYNLGIVVFSDAYSATFIRAHIEKLPARVKVFHAFLRPSIGLLNRMRNYILKIQFRFFLTFNRIHVVLAEFGPMGVFCMKTCEKLQIPLVAHFHGRDAYQKELLNANKENYYKLFDFASAIVVVSEPMRQQLFEIGAPEEKLFLNVYGIDESLFKPPLPKESTSKTVFLSVGRFVPKKAPHLLIQAFRDVLEKLPDAELILLGDGGSGNQSGQLFSACQQLIQGLQLEESVKILGAVSHEVVAQKMREATVFIQHSVVAPDGDAEGTPVSLLEACASGLPVIATRHGGIPDVVRDGENGFLVNEYDLESLKARMIELALNRELAEKLGNAGRKTILERYTMDRSIRGLWQIVRSAIP